MGSSAFEASQAPGGHHHALARLAGEWVGVSRVWFEPGAPSDESPIRGSIRPALGGRFMIHEYESALGGKPLQGVVLIGWHIDAKRYEMAWIDSFHTGSAILFSTGAGEAGPLPNVLCHYGGHDGTPPWGWRTTIEQPDAETLVLTAWNIEPDGQEAKATEIVYRRA